MRTLSAVRRGVLGINSGFARCIDFGRRCLGSIPRGPILFLLCNNNSQCPIDIIRRRDGTKTGSREQSKQDSALDVCPTSSHKMLEVPGEVCLERD